MVLVALVGTGTPALSPVGLLRASLAAAALLADATWSPYLSPRTVTPTRTMRSGSRS